MRWILSILALLILGSVRSQNPSDRIDLRNFDTQFLEHLIKSKIDSVRKDHGLKTMANDSILFIAAKDHANYLIENKKLSHKQYGNDLKYQPWDRVKFYGAKNYIVGENVAKGFVHKRILDKKGNVSYAHTYEDVANNFVTGWVNSPGHYANMITPNYEVTGVAIQFDSARQEIKAVQKFAEVEFKYAFEENKTMFPYSDWTAPDQATGFDRSQSKTKQTFEWGIKVPEDSIEYCKHCNVAVDTNAFKNRLRIKGSRVLFTSPNIDMMHALMTKWKSGLALEFVPYRPVDCGNPEYYTMPSRRNDQSIYNGTILKPIYRKDLKKGFKRSGYKWYYRIKKKGKPTHFEYSLGKLPKDIHGYYEMNVLVIHKKKICRVMHLSDVCGEPMELFYDIPYLTKLNKYQYGVNPSLRELSFTVPFEQGKFRYDYEDIKPLIDSVTSDAFTVQSAKIEAFSSLEGNRSSNERLQKLRARSIINAMEYNQRSEIESEIKTNENWALFHQQIESENALKDLRGLDEAKIRQKLANKEYARSIEPFLAEQRYAKIKLTAKVDVTGKEVGNFLISEFSRLRDSVSMDLNSVGMRKETKRNLDTLSSIQWYMYRLIKQGKVDTLLFEQLTVPLSQDYSKLIKDHLWYDLDIHGTGEGNEKWEGQFYQQLNQLDRLGISSFEIRYDVSNYLMRNWPKRVPYRGDVGRLLESIEVLQETATNDSTKAMADRLWVNYHFANANYRHFSKRSSRDDEEMRKSMVLLEKYFLNNQLSDEDNLKLALFFTWGEQEDLAYNVLHPRMLASTTHGPSIALYTKLTFRHEEEYHDQDYYTWIKNTRKVMSKEDWCGMFVGPCNLSFQLFDNEELRDLYCTECAGIKNYAQRPEDWE